MRDLTITNGSNGFSGGIYNNGTLTLVDVTAIGNTLQPYYGGGSQGGGIFNDYRGTLTLGAGSRVDGQHRDQKAGGFSTTGSAR